MSLERTPTRQVSTVPLVSDTDPVAICSICNECLMEGQNCVIINDCNHIFHRICIENSLAASSQCPVCKRSCQLSELHRYNISSNVPQGESPSLLVLEHMSTNANISKPSGRGKPRGAKAYNTRSYTRSLFNDPQNSLNTTQEIGSNDNDPRSRNLNELNYGRNINNNQQGNKNARSIVDYEQINRMIEESMSRLLQSLNIVPPTAINQTTNSGINPEQTFRNSPGINPGSSYVNPNPQFSAVQAPADLNINNHSNLSSSFRLPYTVDKISSIIQGWNLRFDGSQKGLNVDEFIYRLKALTIDYFEGDFSVICKNLQILLSGRARDWLWRYRKQVQSIQWEEFCRAIRSQYADFKTSSDLLEEIRNRKQKFGETFDIFFDSISGIIDRLDTPMPEAEIVETLTRNLRPEIRQELLYIPIRSVSHLRQLVYKRENFLSDEHVRRNMGIRHNNNLTARRQVAEIEREEVSEPFEPELEINSSVNALNGPLYNVQCWNCDGRGHHWQDCLQARQIFCYGCGTKQVYKPNCLKCKTNYPTISKNCKGIVPTKEQL